MTSCVFVTGFRVDYRHRPLEQRIDRTAVSKIRDSRVKKGWNEPSEKRDTGTPCEDSVDEYRPSGHVNAEGNGFPAAGNRIDVAARRVSSCRAFRSPIDAACSRNIGKCQLTVQKDTHDAIIIADWKELLPAIVAKRPDSSTDAPIF
nr:PREDICTED: uncharacterized protein LOC105664359 [Megachile rotundata]